MSAQSVVKASRNVGADVGLSAPDFELTDTAGNLVKLSSYWTRKTIVLVFLRHFGCPFCREQLVELRQNYSKILAKEAEVVCVGQGPFKAGKAFSILLGLPFPLLVCGEDLTIYEQYGLSKGTLKQLLGVNVIFKGLKALRHGIGSVNGDGRQMPGLFIVNQSGLILFAHRHRDQADNLTAEAILKKLP
jgi:peroxiredoxin